MTSFTKDFIVLKEHYQQIGWMGTLKIAFFDSFELLSIIVSCKNAKSHLPMP